MHVIKGAVHLCKRNSSRYFQLSLTCRTTRRRIHADATAAFHGLRDGAGLVASQSGITAESQLRVLVVGCVARLADVPVAVADVVGAHGPRQSRGRYRVHDDRDRMHPVRTVPGAARILRRPVLDPSVLGAAAAAAAVAASAATAILLKFKSSPAPSDVPVRLRSGSASRSASAERRSRRSDRRIRPRVSSCLAGAVDHPRSAPSPSSSAAAAAPAASLPSADAALAGSTADGNLFAGQRGVR